MPSVRVCDATCSPLRPSPRRAGRTGTLLALAAGIFVFMALLLPGSACALTMTTPYPALTVQAGQTVSLTVTVKDTTTGWVDVGLENVPTGWKTQILGGGYPVSAVMVETDEPLSLNLQIEVPADAAEGTQTLRLVGRRGGSLLAELPIVLTVSEAAAGPTSLTAEYASLRGPAAATYQFSLVLENRSQQARTYNISATGPSKWTLSLKPSGATQETPTVTVQPMGSQSLTLTVTPEPDVAIGTYDIKVTAVGGGETVSAPLQVEITGTYKLTLTTPDGRLNVEIRAGDTTRVPLTVKNEGTGPLRDVTFSATPPTNWKVVFEPDSISELPANEEQTVVAVFTPAKNALAGDYVVTMSANADQAVSQADMRVTVKTSTLWGVLGVLIAIAAIGVLGFVFRRFGHR